MDLICDASFPTHFLTRRARDAMESERFPVGKAIAALTSEPADAVGLIDRGRLRVGSKADIDVIDLASLMVHAPGVVHDLPAGRRRLYQPAEGYAATIVNGIVTYENGVPTGALPGTLVRAGAI